MVQTRSGKSLTPADAPSAADDGADAARIVALACNLLGWYGCNAFFNVLNKEALNRWPYPWAVAWLQLVTGVLIVAPLWASGLRAAPRVDAAFVAKTFGPIGLLHAVGHGAQVVSFGAGSVFMAHVIKALEPMVSVAIGVSCLGQKPSLWTNLSLVPIVGGVVFAASKPGAGLDVAGLTSLPARTALTSTVSFAFAKVLAKKQMTSKIKKDRGLDAANNYALLTCCSCCCIFVPFLLLEGGAAKAALEADADARTILSLVARSGALYYLSNEFSFRVLDLLGPVPQAVANAAKRVFVLAVRGPRAETFRPSASLRGKFHVKAAAACPRQSVNRGRRPLDVRERARRDDDRFR